MKYVKTENWSVITPGHAQSKRIEERTKAKHIAELRSLKRDVAFLQQATENK